MRLHSEKKGFTLIEVLVAVSVASLIIGVLGSVTFQFTRTTERGSGQFVALHDVQNVGHWINMDGKRAQSTNLIDGGLPVQSMILIWDEDGANHTCSYSLSGSDLKRTCDGNTTTIARHITQVGFSVSQRLLTANITSQPEGRWDIQEQAVYKVWMRPSE